eukprot:jgi/Chlat1/5310/Chrsp35S05199
MSLRTAAAVVVLLLLGLAGLSHAASPRLLVFSKTAGYQHKSIPAAHAALVALGKEHGFLVDAPSDNQDAYITDASLAKYKAVVFCMTTGDVLNTTQQGALQRFIRNGGGWMGIHSASDTEYDWPWYGRLVGAYFDYHVPGEYPASVRVTPWSRGRRLVGTRLPAVWNRTDEWYNFRSNPRGKVLVLATLDERTYSGGSMGADHPIIWCHDFDGGRAWYTAMGHAATAYSEVYFRQHLLAGINYVLNVKGFRHTSTVNDGEASNNSALQALPISCGCIIAPALLLAVVITFMAL